MGFNAFNEITTKNIDIKKNNSHYMSIIEVLEMKHSEDRNNDIEIDGSISVKDLCFSHEDNNVVNNCKVDIESGARIAIVGESGCGKTTLVKLMLGMLMPDSGNICYSNITLNDISKSYLYSQIGIVMQDPFFFNLTIKENLILSAPSITMNQIEKSCKLACIHDFINSLPESYDTYIGENGVKLSGGQKQRLAIARALLNNPKILFLDEATSALDEDNERNIIEHLTREYPKLTIILISHKPSVVALMERKINLSKIS